MEILKGLYTQTLESLNPNILVLATPNAEALVFSRTEKSRSNFYS